MAERLRDYFEEQGMDPKTAQEQERKAALFFMAIIAMYEEDVPDQKENPDEAA